MIKRGNLFYVHVGFQLAVIVANCVAISIVSRQDPTTPEGVVTRMSIFVLIPCLMLFIWSCLENAYDGSRLIYED
jgi:hypothetical protein